MKRAFDLVASAIGLLLLSPVMALIAILVRRESGPPAIFKQKRVGRFGHPFTLYKFRTMRPSHASAPQVTSAGDDRVTALGRRLRSMKADELPQLWNVLRGDMSIVGPRPEVQRYVDQWPADERDIILSVRPGITDPITSTLRREEELLASQRDPESYYVTELLPAKTGAYTAYVRERSFTGDLGIIFRTLFSVVRN